MIEVSIDKLLSHIGRLYVEREEFREKFEGALKRLADEVATLQQQGTEEVEDDDATGESGARPDTSSGGA